MKSIFFILLFLGFTGFSRSTVAQSEIATQKEDPVAQIVVKKAKLVDNWQNIIQENLKYPVMAKAAKLSAQVMVKIIIEKDGAISNINVDSNAMFEDPAYSYLVNEAIRVVKLLPSGSPAYSKDGMPVRSYYRLPIMFRLKN